MNKSNTKEHPDLTIKHLPFLIIPYYYIGGGVGAFDGEAVGAFVGEAVGVAVGAFEGEAVGAFEGEAVGAAVGESVATGSQTPRRVHPMLPYVPFGSYPA